MKVAVAVAPAYETYALIGSVLLLAVCPSALPHAGLAHVDRFKPAFPGRIPLYTR